MIDPNDHTAISEALAQHLKSGWSQATALAIEAAHGVAIAQTAKAVYDAAMDCPVDWRTATMDQALGTLSEFLTAQYPWLSARARTQLNYAYILAWK